MSDSPRRPRVALASLCVALLASEGVLAGSQGSEGEGERLARGVGELVPPLVEAEVFQAVVVGFLDREGNEHAFAFGRLSAEDPRPPDEHTLFEIGSLTKVFTGLALAYEVKAGGLSLGDPVDRHLPERLRAADWGGAAPLLVELATHTSGLPHIPTNFDESDATRSYAEYGLERFSAYLASGSLGRGPSGHYAYSNLGMALLGQALAHTAGSDYESLVVSRLCEPLGLTSTRVVVAAEDRARLAPGHDANLDRAPAWDFRSLVACGGLHSDLQDLLRFARAMGHPDAPLADVLALSRERQFSHPDSRRGMGLGWMIGADGATLFHTGQTGGFAAYLAIPPGRRGAVVVLANTSAAEVVLLGDQLLACLVGAEYRPLGVAPPVPLDEETLERLVGLYRYAGGFDLEISRRGGRLYAQILRPGQGLFRIYPESADRFRYRQIEAAISFSFVEGDAGDRPAYLTLHQNGRNLRCLPVETGEPRRPRSSGE